MCGMPRADRLTLNATGLAMPPVDHLSNRSSDNVLLDRTISGRHAAGLPRDRSLVGLFMNFIHLTDKALREYDAARTELALYVARSEGGLRTRPYMCAIDHMEDCISATHRAVLNSQALQANGAGGRGPRLTQLQEQRLSHVRNAVEHSDEKDPWGSEVQGQSALCCRGALFSSTCQYVHDHRLSDRRKGRSAPRLCPRQDSNLRHTV